MVVAEDGPATPRAPAPAAAAPAPPAPSAVPVTPTQSVLRSAAKASGSAAKRTPVRTPVRTPALHVSSSVNRSVHLAIKSPARTPTAAAATPHRSPHKSPGVEIWEYQDSDGSDYESPSESEMKKTHHVPGWARGSRLQDALAAQEHVNPDTIFRCITTIDLDRIFTEDHARPFRRRTSSANWAHDRATWNDQLAYNKAMGFAQQQP